MGADAQLLEWSLRATVILARVGMIIHFLPILGETFMPARVRALLTLALTGILLPTVPVDPAVIPSSVLGFIVAMVPELLLGMTLGLTARLIFAAVQLGGQMAGEQIGFGIANVVDPSNQSQISITSQIYYLFTLLLFLALNGHHVMLGMIYRSFEVVPLFTVNQSLGAFDFINLRVAEMYALAVIVGAPIVAAMLLANMALGLVSKAVPQVNIFIESFPIRIMAGLLIMGLTFSAVGVLLAQNINRLDADFAHVLQLLR